MQDKVSLNLMDYDLYKREWDKLQELRGKRDDAETEYQHMLDEDVPVNVSKVRERITMFQRAATQQEKRLSSAHIEVSKKIAKSYEPIYKAIIKDMCTKWCELGELVVKEITLRESLNDNDIAYVGSFTPMVIHSLGSPLEHTSRFSGWLVEAVQRGYFKTSDIPKEFRDSWLKQDGVKL